MFGTESFRAANGLTITSPLSDKVVATPLTVRWKSTYPAGTEYALFFDAPPIGPGQTMRAVPESIHDSTCLAQPSCPSATYLAQDNIYLTKSNSFVLPAFQSSAGYDALILHRLTIVALGPNGRRLGEAAYWVDFRTHANSIGGTT
jgi:hypothetical protein